MFPDCLRRHGKPGPSIPGLLNHFDANSSYTRLHHVEFARRGSTHINDPASYEWASIGNPDCDILIVAQVGNPNDRAVGQRAMRGCHFLGVITLAAGCLSALELFAVP